MAPKKKKAKDTPQLDNEQRFDKLEYARVPKRVRRLLVEGKLDMSKHAMNAARRWTENEEHTFLVLAGGVGTGKTIAAAWTIEQACEHHDICFMPAPQLAGFSRYGDSDELRWVLCCDLLVLDDLGMEHLGERGYFLSLFDEVVEERYENERRTVITTNFTGEHFVNRYGQRVADRLREAGLFIEIAEESMRGKEDF